MRIGRFDDGMSRWGFEDIEISLRAWLLGYRVIGVPAVLVGHHFRDCRGFEVTDLGVLFNFLRMIHLHFAPTRIELITRALGPYPGLDVAMAQLECSDVLAVRYELEKVRPRDDAWFVTRFGPATPAFATA
jgi:hypothetical protein